jgi:aldose 1-epimerase
MDNVVLAYPDLASYEEQPAPRAYYGATIGRFANRIAHGRFELGDQTHHIVQNEGAHALHGGGRGFDRVVWSAVNATEDAVRLAYRSAHGEEGFPGTLDVTVAFAVTGDALTIAYQAQSDRDTAINLTNHSYFNLSPRSNAVAADHILQIFADSYTPVDEELIPTGEVLPVQGTRYDFTSPRAIGAEPYDTNWALRNAELPLHSALMLGHPVSGRVMEVHTTEPGVQIYTGNARGIAIETQHFPDSPNQPQFPSTTLRAGDVFRSLTRYRFSR